MIQNNQIALDTINSAQSGAETFGDKGHAMGIPPGLLMDLIQRYSMHLLQLLRSSPRMDAEQR